MGMTIRASGLFASLLVALAAASPAAAQDGATVRATDAEGLMEVLRAAQYEELEYYPAGDDGTSPYISLTSNELTSLIIFSDCDEAVPDFCDTLVLSTSWDRTLPISDAAIAEANLNFRYVSVWRDEEGDPFAQWAILTRDDGIPAPLFLDALDRYLGVVQDFWEVAFDGDEDEGGAETGAEGSQAPVALAPRSAGNGS